MKPKAVAVATAQVIPFPIRAARAPSSNHRVIQDALARRAAEAPAGPVVIHTDGACSGKLGPGGWAAVFSHLGEIIFEFSGGENDTTKSRMELRAILEAIRHAPRSVSLEIATDSKKAIGWLTDGWKRNDQDIATLCAQIDELLGQSAAAVNQHTSAVRLRHVRGRSSDPLSQRADSLARAAIERLKSHQPAASPTQSA